MKIRNILCMVVLLTGACSSPPPAGYDASGSVDDVNGVLKMECGVCHAPPVHTVYPAREWGMILDRMNKHRLEAGMKPLTEDARRMVMNALHVKK